MARRENERYQKKSDPKKSERPNIWFVIALIAGSALFLTAIFGSHGLMRWLQSDQEKKTLIVEQEKIEKQNIQTRREIDSLMHNEKYIETIARRDLGMVKADEIIYQFPASEENPETIKPIPAGH